MCEKGECGSQGKHLGQRHMQMACAHLFTSKSRVIGRKMGNTCGRKECAQEATIKQVNAHTETNIIGERWKGG